MILVSCRFDFFFLFFIMQEIELEICLNLEKKKNGSPNWNSNKMRLSLAADCPLSWGGIFVVLLHSFRVKPDQSFLKIQVRFI